MSDPPSYQSYLLRLWQVKNDGEGWRVLLTHVDTGEQKIFTDLEALFAYLREIAQGKLEPGANSPQPTLAP